MDCEKQTVYAAIQISKERKGKFEDNYFGDCGSVTGSRFTGVEEDGLFDGGCGIDNRRGSY